jgi:hypothetical protein
MDQRDRVAVGRADRQAQPFMRQLPDEGRDAGRRRANIGACRRRDVNSPVLTARIRVTRGDERRKHGPLDGPRPSLRRRAQHEHEHESGSNHEQSVADTDNHERAE